MRKPYFILAFAIFFSFISHAQIRIALVAGGHQSTVKEENDLSNWDDIKKYYSGRVGIHIGFIADIPFSIKSPVSFQPGVVYYNKGRKFARQYDPSTSLITSERRTQYINYIDIPLNLVYKFGKKTKLIIGGGPFLSFFYSGKETSQLATQSTITETENDDLPIGKKPGQYRVPNYGVNGLLGLESHRVFFTVNYSLGLNDFYTANNYNGTFRHQIIGGTIGIFLGQPAAMENKVKDADKDGIPDEQDNCPNDPGSIITKGCPDKDGDGIADKDDKCPDINGLVINNGCPQLDNDRDGVNDIDDKCPDIPGAKKYNGCPAPDSDKDGINDEEDKCPTVVGYGRYEGCPVPDRDADGINDEEDKCPDEKGNKDNNGCPPGEIKKEIIEKINYAAQRIQFKSAKADLLPPSFIVLNEVVKILNDNPELKVSIEGHTSGDGSMAANMLLSDQRANTVKTYLQSKGIALSRLTAKGFGPNQPLNSGKTASEKSQNRRVEMKLSN
ncbi:MAG: OmpA family protein [Chitinophagaceae bacterium]